MLAQYYSTSLLEMLTLSMCTTKELQLIGDPTGGLLSQRSIGLGTLCSC